MEVCNVVTAGQVDWVCVGDARSISVESSAAIGLQTVNLFQSLLEYVRLCLVRLPLFVLVDEIRVGYRFVVLG